MGTREAELRPPPEDGVLPVVCPVADGSDIRGIGIFNAGINRAGAIMDDDLGVRNGAFIYKVPPVPEFPR